MRTYNSRDIDFILKNNKKKHVFMLIIVLMITIDITHDILKT